MVFKNTKTTPDSQNYENEKMYDEPKQEGGKNLQGRVNHRLVGNWY